MSDATPLPPIVSRAEWEKARAELLVKEKELTRFKDSVSAARRRMPMVEITEPYVFGSEGGPVTLLDLFGGPLGGCGDGVLVELGELGERARCPVMTGQEPCRRVWGGTAAGVGIAPAAVVGLVLEDQRPQG